MDIDTILKITLFSTVVMTVFSYVLTRILNEDLVEPYWLNVLLFKKRLLLRPLGWLIHFITGIGFFYLLVVLNAILDFGIIINGLAVGVLEGFIGILMWYIAFNFIEKPDNLKLKLYYYNLMGAHIIFSYTALIFLH
jgi:hypothetical protein